MSTSRKKIQNKILQEQGIVLNRRRKHKHRSIKKMPLADLEHLKTPHMRYIEMKYGDKIERILMSGSLSQVKRKLNGELDTSTISRWITKLGLRYDANNLPVCKDCKHEDDMCKVGLCVLLLTIGRIDLAKIKREEILNETK